jgi:glutamate synthase (NADPH/NADH) small chain
LYKETEELDFKEIIPVFYPEQAMKEAEKCLYCYDAPCRQNCPAGIDIPHFIQAIRSSNFKRAARIINKENPFGAVCGRVCPTSKLCEGNCSAIAAWGTSVEIGRLQAFAIEYGEYIPPKANITKNEKVAVIGSGPAGLACARELIRNNYHVTVFESKKKAGGMVSFGVPEYRCSHDITACEVDLIEKEGVEIRTATPVNQDVSLLFNKGYSAVFVAVGLTKMIRPEIPGIDLQGLYMGLDFLTRVNNGDAPDIGKKVIVVGGGDTAIDCARTAVRLGADSVTLMYRRSFSELPAEQIEIDDALDEGVIFRTLTLPVELVGDDEKILRAVEAVNIKLGNPDSSGRRKPEIIKGSNYRLACNTVIFSIGFEPSKLLRKLMPKAEFEGVYPVVDPQTYMTTCPGIFCGGDVVNGGATVVQAVADGKAAARSIIDYLEEKNRQLKEKPAITMVDLEDEVEVETDSVEIGVRAEKLEAYKYVEPVDASVEFEEEPEPEIEDVAPVEEVEELQEEEEIEPVQTETVIETKPDASGETGEESERREQLKKKWKDKVDAKKSSKPKEERSGKGKRAGSSKKKNR